MALVFDQVKTGQCGPQWDVICKVAATVAGTSSETPGKWVRQAEVNAGVARGPDVLCRSRTRATCIGSRRTFETRPRPTTRPTVPRWVTTSTNTCPSPPRPHRLRTGRSTQHLKGKPWHVDVEIMARRVNRSFGQPPLPRPSSDPGIGGGVLGREAHGPHLRRARWPGVGAAVHLSAGRRASRMNRTTAMPVCGVRLVSVGGSDVRNR